jgi:hypothetical protein
MDNNEVEFLSSHPIENGFIGLLSGSILFIPGYLLTSALFQHIFFDILHKARYSNGDDILLSVLCFPIAAGLSFVFGMLGGWWGANSKHTQKAAIIGSITVGGVGGLLIAGMMAYEIVRGWAAYYD